MHVSRADRSDESSSIFNADNVSNKHGPSAVVSADCDEPILCVGMLQVWRNPRIAEQKRLNLGDGYAVLTTFLAIARVPVEAFQS
jgi:hypothetical protein